MKKIYALVALLIVGTAANAQCEPTAMCKDTTVYLDGSGLFVIDPADLDNGSTLATGGGCTGTALSFGADITTFSCASVTDISSVNSLIISAVFDADLAGGTPKGIEIYAINDIADLSIYGIGSANNGGGSDGQEFTFPAVALAAGSHIFVASEIPQFTAFFGFAPDYTSGSMGINGDDAIELFKDGVVIDVFGDINTDGNGETWEYVDGWAARNNLETPNLGVFVDTDWTYSGVAGLDTETDNATAATPIPVGVFTTPSTLGNPVVLTVTDNLGNFETCNSRIIVLDTLAPTVACVGATSMSLDATGNLTITTGDLDNGTADNCGTTALTLSQSTFTCADEGVNTVYLIAEDQYGNIDSCSTDITIAPMGTISIDGITSDMATCFGNCDGVLTIAATNATMYSIDNGLVFQSSNVFNNLCAGTYDVVVMSDAANCSQTVNTTAAIDEPTEITISLSVTDVDCFGNDNGEIDMTVSGGTPGNPPYIFDWDNDGAGDMDDAEDLSGLSPATYNVVVEDANGCTAMGSEDVVEGSVIDLTTTVTGFDLMSNEANAVSYQWLDCSDDSPITGATSQSYTATANGDYEVEITVGTCVDTSDCQTIAGVSIDEKDNAVFNVYPNPSNGNVYVELAENTSGANVSVIDINGKVVANTAATTNTILFDLSALENGIYFVQIKANNTVTTKKISLTK